MIMTRALAEVSNLKVNRLKHTDVCKFPYWCWFGVFVAASFQFILSIKLASFCLLLPFPREIIIEYRLYRYYSFLREQNKLNINLFWFYMIFNWTAIKEKMGRNGLYHLSNIPAHQGNSKRGKFAHASRDRFSFFSLTEGMARGNRATVVMLPWLPFAMVARRSYFKEKKKQE